MRTPAVVPPAARLLRFGGSWSAGRRPRKLAAFNGRAGRIDINVTHGRAEPGYRAGAGSAEKMSNEPGLSGYSKHNRMDDLNRL